MVETNRIYQVQNGVLEIKILRVEDEGFYVCSMSNKKSIKYAQAELVVNGNKHFFLYLCLIVVILNLFS